MVLTPARLLSHGATWLAVACSALASAVWVVSLGCSPAGSRGTSAAEPAASAAPPSSSPAHGPASSAAAPDRAGRSAPADVERAASAATAPVTPAAPIDPVAPGAQDAAAKLPAAIGANEAESILFVDEASRSAPEVVACRRAGAAPEHIRCLLDLRFKGDRRAREIARDLYDHAGHVVGLAPEQQMDGGYRGMLHLVPEAPVGANVRHLAWVAAASRDFDDFLAGLAPAAPRPLRYRVRPLALRYFRSVNARTPSAYAYDWTVAYNVAGSLHVSADAVRETMFHEIFHLNDSAHDGWSTSALSSIYDAIVSRCGTKIACLRPYAPHDTVVRGGTYYAFQPGNGVGEYAAELAVRYYREQRAALRKAPLGAGTRSPFKCGPPENGRAWALFVDEFFGGADLVPTCASSGR